VEGHPQPGIWEDFTKIAGFTGEAAFRMASFGNEYMDPLAHDAEKTDIPYKLTYRVYVPETGEYLIRIRNYHWLKDGDNDAWIGINDDLYEKIWDHDTLVWSWNEAIAWQFAYQSRWLQKGVNTICIVGRSENWVIDRLAVVQKDIPDERWQSAGLPESEKLIRIGQPEKPINLSCVKVGSTYAVLDWDEPVNAVAYQIFVNDVYLKTTYKTEASIGDLNINQGNKITVIAENSYGETSNPAILEVKTTNDHVVDCTFFSEVPDWDKVPNCSDSENATLQVAALDSMLLVKLTFNHEKGCVNISLDPDNSKSETFSMADRLYYSKIEALALKERVDRNTNVEDVELKMNTLEDNKVEMLLEISYKTLGKVLKQGDLFGMKVWISKGEKGEDPLEFILGEEFEQNANFPSTFREMIVAIQPS
jgi:hypothetical protein